MAQGSVIETKEGDTHLFNKGFGVAHKGATIAPSTVHKYHGGVCKAGSTRSLVG